MSVCDVQVMITVQLNVECAAKRQAEQGDIEPNRR